MSFGSSIGRATDVTKELRQCWTTPKDLFNQLDSIFNFTVDACANSDNHLCPKYWSIENDCRLQNWSNEIVFCNPPFGETATIINKAREATSAVFLLPITCLVTKYFKLYAPQAVAIPSYRIKFAPPAGLVCKSNPTLGTVLLLYGASQNQIEQVKQLFLVYQQ